MTTDIKEAARASARISGTALERTTLASGKTIAYKGVAFHMITALPDCDGVVLIAADRDALARALKKLRVKIDVDWSMCPKVVMTKDKEQA